MEGGVPKHEIGFNDVTIRSAFIQKVFGIVSIMVSVYKIYFIVNILNFL